jgi:hypothetical protein
MSISGEVGFATLAIFFSDEVIFCYNIFFATMSPARYPAITGGAPMKSVCFVGEPFFATIGLVFLAFMETKVRFQAEIDFTTNESFFATLVHYGSKSGIGDYCDTCCNVDGQMWLIQLAVHQGMGDLIPGDAQHFPSFI